MAKKQTTITIDKDLLEKGQERAKKERRSFTSLLEVSLERYLDFIDK